MQFQYVNVKVLSQGVLTHHYYASHTHTVLHSLPTITAIIDASAMEVWMSQHNSDMMIYCLFSFFSFFFSPLHPFLLLRAFVRDNINDLMNSFCIFRLSGKMQLAIYKSVAFINFTNERLVYVESVENLALRIKLQSFYFSFIKYQLVGLWMSECCLLFLTLFLYTKMGKKTSINCQQCVQ